MKDKKIYIVLLGVIMLFFLITFLTLILPNIQKNKKELTLVLENHSIFRYHNQKWMNIDKKEYINGEKFTIFLDGKDYGKYELVWQDENWRGIDSSKKQIPLEGTLFAYKSNYKVTVPSYVENNSPEKKYINTILKKYNIDSSIDFTSSYIISLDFDKDGIIEDFYAISNAFQLNETSDIVFSFAFMVKNEEIYIMYEDTRTDNYYDACKPYYSGFIDVNEDNQYEIILNCGRYSVENPITTLYEFVNNDFKKVISNE